MLAENYEFRGLLLPLKDKGLLKNGEYIVIGVDSKHYNVMDSPRYLFDGQSLHPIFYDNLIMAS